jgi:hypothetical protein
MLEAVGAGNHKTALAMVRAANALWDALDGHDPMVTATMTQRSRSPSSSSNFFSFQNLGNGPCKFHNF